MNLLRTVLDFVWRHGSALAGGIVISIALFLFAPVLQFYSSELAMPKDEKVFQVASAESMLPEKKKAKPREAKAQTKKAKSAGEGPKSVARSKFAMDLGVGGGTGGGGVAVGGGDAGEQQMTYEEGETDSDVEALRTSPPKYPEEARKAGISGLVRALLTIDENGDVAQVQILEQPGDYGFERSIREAVAQWKFRPASVGGVPVRQKIEQPFKF